MNRSARVVVTGIGVISPVGNSLKESWEAIKAGRSGIGPVTKFNADIPWRWAGELKGFHAGEHMPSKDIKRLDAFVHYAYAAARMAVGDSGLRPSCLKEAGIVIGSSRGGISSIEAGVIKRPTAYMMSGTTVSMAASYSARRLGVNGPILGISSACASGASAIGEAFRLIREGYAKVVIAGGADAPLCRLCVWGYGISGALSKTGISRPFDKNRDGFIPAEGAAALALEQYASARRRGAKIYGEIAGYGNAADACHQTAPDKDGQARAIRAALKDAGIGPEDADYINAHAASTPLGDKSEAGAIRLVFGNKTAIPVSAHKSMTGHMLGASGAFEAAMTLMSLKEGVIPPTINIKAPEYGLNYVTELTMADMSIALSNSFGFGGVNAALVLRALNK